MKEVAHTPCNYRLFRVGESLASGFAPTAVFPSRWLAGGVTLERCGAILDERVAADGSDGGAAG